MELQESPVVGRFDLVHLQGIHSYLFQDLYAWAGKIRTVDISKGSTFFAHHAAIQSYADKQIFPAIERDKLLVGLDKPLFVKRLAFHYAEINALHPFREGNGRSMRQFIEQLARHAGFDLDYTKVVQNDWINAATASFAGNLVPM
nr:Fic family protein [Janthinobacterium sp. JC611]